MQAGSKHPILNFDINPPSSSTEDDGAYEVCIANISPAERRKRLRFGIIQFVLGLILFGVLLITGADKVWRLGLILPFGSAAAGFFQWRDKTWVALAGRGSRQLTDKVEEIENPNELKQVRLQALKVLGKSFLVSLVFTLIALALP